MVVVGWWVVVSATPWTYEVVAHALLAVPPFAYLRDSHVMSGRHVLRGQEVSETPVELLVRDPHGKCLPTNADNLETAGREREEET